MIVDLTLAGLATSQKLLPPRSDHFIQARFTTIRGVSMNNAALGRPIEGRDKGSNVFGGRLGCGARALLQCAKPRSHAPILN